MIYGNAGVVAFCVKDTWALVAPQGLSPGYYRNDSTLRGRCPLFSMLAAYSLYAACTEGVSVLPPDARIARLMASSWLLAMVLHLLRGLVGMNEEWARQGVRTGGATYPPAESCSWR